MVGNIYNGAVSVFLWIELVSYLSILYASDFF